MAHASLTKAQVAPTYYSSNPKILKLRLADESANRNSMSNLMKSNRGASASALLLVLTAVLLCFVCQEAAAQKDYSCFRAPANPGDRRKIPTRYAHIVFCIVADLIFDFQFSSFATTCKIVVHVTEFNLSEDLRLPPSIPNGCS